MTTEIIPDDRALRRERRERVLAEMAAADVDALVLGREANARYVSGVPRLWLAGTRPFGPGCVLVRATGAIHLLSPWDEGVPDDIPREHLYGYTFNAAKQLEALRVIEGSQQFRTVATDAMGPGAADLLLAAFPAATIVDGERVLATARRTKSPAEVAAIAASVGIAERCLDAASQAVRPGATARQLTGVFMEAMGSEAVCMPSTQDVAWVTSRTQPWQRATRDTPIAPGDLVVLSGGVMLDGYTGDLARTVVVGDASPAAASLLTRGEALWNRLLDACRPGAPASDLLQVYADAAEPVPPMPIAHGLGLGFDAPVVTAALPRSAADERLEPGMVIALTAAVWAEGVGTVIRQSPVLLTAAGAELITSAPALP